MPLEQLTKASLAAAAQDLAQRDKDLAAILKAHGSPPLWSRQPGFSTLIRIILEQQVSLASAASMYKRLSDSVQPFEPDRVIELGAPYLKSLGLTRQKTAYCMHLAESINSHTLKLRGLSKMNDEGAKAALMEVKGIGSWSADIYLLMVLRRPDIWPASDLALATAVTKLKELKQRATTDQLFDIAERWRPFRSVAARMLWQSYLARREARL
ncbi:MAG: DNA-3-methyladenine glycosylase 2 family protein [Acidobacteriota bacterium]|nr:DNA-3-methyladenine glycosylase 2 family protein [Acidobacteriota bacterium]